ncbi:MAG: hypothetical protein HZY76_04860 [Anaerolineae bacterium]|nr:MAG: hypothetical protein HZY76_04860 [Anaerolineae bacterium]
MIILDVSNTAQPQFVSRYLTPATSTVLLYAITWPLSLTASVGCKSPMSAIGRPLHSAAGTAHRAWHRLSPWWATSRMSPRSGGLQVINVQNPQLPTLVTAHPALGTLWDVTVAGNYVYAAAGKAGVLVYRAS